MTDSTAATQRMARLDALEGSATLDEALAFFDDCPAVEVEDMLGHWRGGGLATGHPMDGMLEATGWHGKHFDSADAVHPLVFGRRPHLFSVNPALLPMRTAVSLNPLLQKRAVSAFSQRVIRLARTAKPAARLRMMQYRGIATATMSYDALPINDHFRKVDDDTVIGAMDFRGIDQPFLFTLRREAD